MANPVDFKNSGSDHNVAVGDRGAGDVSGSDDLTGAAIDEASLASWFSFWRQVADDYLTLASDQVEAVAA